VKTVINIRVNRIEQSHEVEPRTLLVHFLRDCCRLTGTHVGCETSICGACTVLFEGKAVKSCTLLAVQADGSEVTTIEGLAADGRLHPVQEGFWERHGLQCGYCTPGMILTAHALLTQNDAPTRDDIVEAISGNICRCTGYGQIVEAVEFAADRLRKANTPRPHHDGPHAHAEHDAPIKGVPAAADKPVVEAK